MAIIDARYPSRAEANTRATKAGFLDFKISKDSKGFYISEGRYPGDSGLTVRDEVPRTIVEKTEIPPAAPKPIKDGPVHQIREWVRSHPDATKKEAVEYLTANYGFNVTTIQIQWARVRRGIA